MDKPAMPPGDRTVPSGGWLDQQELPSKTGFLDLPFELREKIYLYTFNDGIKISSGYNPRSRPYYGPSEACLLQRPLDPLYQVELSPSPLSLMLSCKQVRHDLHKTIPEQVLLHIDTQQDFDALTTWLGKEVSYLCVDFFSPEEGRHLFNFPNLKKLCWPASRFDIWDADEDHLQVAVTLLIGTLMDVQDFIWWLAGMHRVRTVESDDLYLGLHSNKALANKKQFLNIFALYPYENQLTYSQWNWQRTLRWAISHYLEENDIPENERIESRFKEYMNDGVKANDDRDEHNNVTLGSRPRHERIEKT